VTLVQLRYLVAIVDAGLNISLAAQQAHSTQPGLSKQLSQIEDELGFKVFIRRGKRLQALTEAGREVIDRAKVILLETAGIQALAANRRKDARGELKIATTATQARFVLPPMLASLRGKFPDVALHISDCGGAEALERLERETTDIAIVSSPTAPRTSHLVLPLYRWELIALVPGAHRLASQVASLTLADLAAEPLMTYEAARAPDSSHARAFADLGLETSLAATARDSEIIKSLVRSGAGVGLVAEMAWAPEDSDLAQLKVSHLFESHTVWAVLARDRILHNPVLEFITSIAPHLQRADLRAAFDRSQDAGWPQPPLWRDLHGPAAPVGRHKPSTPSRPALRLVAQA
jgi:DNA-binding transcriptional LysR family regulator